MNVAGKVSLKTVGANGQISFGKKYAGRHVLVEEQSEGVWIVRTAQVIPDSEAWLHAPQTATDLKSALGHAVATPARSDTTDAILDRAHSAA